MLRFTHYSHHFLWAQKWAMSLFSLFGSVKKRTTFPGTLPLSVSLCPMHFPTKNRWLVIIDGLSLNWTMSPLLSSVQFPERSIGSSGWTFIEWPLFSIMIQFSARFWLWLINFYGIGGRAILPLNAFSCCHIVKEWRRTWGRLQQFRQGWSYFPHFPFLSPCLMQVNLFCEVKQIFPFKWVRLLQEQGKIQVRRFM